MKNLIKKAIGKTKTAAKVTKEAVKELVEEDPGFCLAMAAMTGVNIIALLLQMRYFKYADGWKDGWNDGAEETRKSLITALVNNRIGHGESEADAFKLANSLVETVKRK